MDDFTSPDDEKENQTLNDQPLNDTIKNKDTISAPPQVYVTEDVYSESIMENDDSVDFDKSFNIEDLASFESDTVYI